MTRGTAASDVAEGAPVPPGGRMQNTRHPASERQRILLRPSSPERSATATFESSSRRGLKTVRCRRPCAPRTIEPSLRPGPTPGRTPRRSLPLRTYPGPPPMRIHLEEWPERAAWRPTEEPRSSFAAPRRALVRRWCGLSRSPGARARVSSSHRAAPAGRTAAAVARKASSHHRRERRQEQRSKERPRKGSASSAPVHHAGRVIARRSPVQ